MVTDTAVETPVAVAEVAPVETPVEETASVQFDESPPASAEESAPDEAITAEPDLATQLASLREELAEVKRAATQAPQRSESDIRAEIEENLRVQQRVVEDQRQQEHEWKQELNESLHALLTTKGYGEVQPEEVSSIGERFINKRYDQIANRTVVDVRNALLWIAEKADRKPSTVALSPKAADYAGQLMDSFNTIHGRLRTQIAESGEYVPKADFDKQLKAGVDAEIARRNAKSREGEENVKRVEGAPSTIDRSHQPTIDRVARGLGDAQDAEYAAKYVERIRNK